MTILAALATDNAIEVDGDSLGGSPRIEETNVYDCTIDVAYLRTANSGALALEVHMTSEQGANVRQTLWMTSGTAKGGNNFYTDKSGKRKYLPGFIAANDLALLAANKEIGSIETEEKVVKLYDYTAKEEVPTKVQMFSDLIGKPVKAGIQLCLEDKNVKNDAGVYVPSGETRNTMEVSKFFYAETGVTVTEAKAGVKEGEFINRWIEKNAGSIRDKSTKDAAKTGMPVGAMASNSAAPAAPTSLFA